MGSQSEANELLSKIYYSLEGGPGSFSSPLRLLQAAKSKNSTITRKNVDYFLRGIKGYSRHSRILRRFPTRSYLSLAPNEYWQTDLIYVNTLQNITNQRTVNQPNYAIVVCDMFSLFCYAEIMTRKRPEDTVKAFQKILDTAKKQPSLLQSDLGSEYFGVFADFCQARNIHLYASSTKQKSARVEIVNSQIKLKLARMMTQFGSKNVTRYLPLAVKSYNASQNDGLPLGISPQEAQKLENISKVQKYHLINRSKFAEKMLKKYPHPKFKVGDTVRKVAATILGAQRVSKPRFSDEIYQISAISKTLPRMYSIGVEKQGKQQRFYRQELRLVRPSELDELKILDIISSKKQALTYLRSGKAAGYETLYLVAIQGLEAPKYLSAEVIERDYKNGRFMLQTFHKSKDGVV